MLSLDIGKWQGKERNSKESQFSAYERERRIKYNKKYLIFFPRKRINLEGIERKKKIIEFELFFMFLSFHFS